MDRLAGGTALLAGATILAVDDDPNALFALEQTLLKNGCRALTAGSAKEALVLLEREIPDIILSDVTMPGMDGLELTRRLKSDSLWKYIPVVLLTAKDTLEDLVSGLDQGADDYLKKPYSPEELLARIKAILRLRRVYSQLKEAEDSNMHLRNRLGEQYSFSSIIGRSSAMAAVFSLIERIAPSDVPVLISGESGTGKELVASAIHQNSTRRGRQLVVQNCSAFNENLLESEFFGHVKGAFTGAIRDKQGLFETADGGTFFLDELGEMSPALQVKLLRVVQDGTFTPVGGTSLKKVNVRIIAATSRDLRAMVSEGTFREDLYYRLNVVNIKLPPLRERINDIPLLVDHFLAATSRRTGQPIKKLSKEALLMLCDYQWPGNIRELQNEIERLVVLSGPQEEIGSDLLSPHIVHSNVPAPGETASAGKLHQALAELERRLIKESLDQSGGNKSAAARQLGIARSNLIAKVKEYGLE